MASKRSTGSKSSTDAIAVLKADHDKVKKLLREFEKSQKEQAHDAAEDIAKQICDELTIHATIEQEIFYPEMREAVDDAELVDEAEVEHNVAKSLIEQIESTDTSAEKQDTAKVHVLGEVVKQHIDEEQKKLFPKAQKAGLDLKEIGHRLLSRKHELRSEMGLANEP